MWELSGTAPEKNGGGVNRFLGSLRIFGNLCDKYRFEVVNHAAYFLVRNSLNEEPAPAGFSCLCGCFLKLTSQEYPRCFRRNWNFGTKPQSICELLPVNHRLKTFPIADHLKANANLLEV